MPESPSAVPAGSCYCPDPTTVVRDGGRHLLGGVPLRSVRLSDRGATVATDLLDGRPVGEGESERRLARRLLAAGLLHPRPPLGPTADVTVVTPVRDDRGGVAAVVAAHPDVAVVVVDDGSMEPVTVAGGAVQVRRHATPRGPGAARMTGLAAVSTPLVAFVDADVRCPPEWMGRLVGHFDDPSVAAVAPRVRAVVGPSVLERYERDASPLDLGPDPSAVGPGRRVAYLPSAALLVRVDALIAAGGFDPALRYGEDVDLVWRLVAAGHTVRYDPAVEVEHRNRDTWSAWWRQRGAYGSSAAALAERHGDAVAPAVFGPPVLAAVSAGVVAPPPVAVLTAGVAAVVTRRRVARVIGAKVPAGVVERGLLHACRSTVEALLRAWWPFTFLASVSSRRVRRRLSALLLIAAVVDGDGRHRSLDPVRRAAIRLVDHAAYGVGVWRGVLAHRSMRCVVPRLVGRSADPSATTFGGA